MKIIHKEENVHIGKKLREIRRLRGVSIADLGKALGVTHQQIYKYEVGQDNISASRLKFIALLLSTDITEFYSISNPASMPSRASAGMIKEFMAIPVTMQRKLLDIHKTLKQSVA